MAVDVALRGRFSRRSGTASPVVLCEVDSALLLRVFADRFSLWAISGVTDSPELDGVELVISVFISTDAGVVDLGAVLTDEFVSLTCRLLVFTACTGGEDDYFLFNAPELRFLNSGICACDADCLSDIKVCAASRRSSSSTFSLNFLSAFSLFDSTVSSSDSVLDIFLLFGIVFKFGVSYILKF